MNSRRNLLIPVDLSKASEVALRWATDNLVRQSDVIHIFHVLPRKHYVVVSSTLMMDEVPPVLEEIVEDGERTNLHDEEKALSYIKTYFSPILEEAQVEFDIDICRFKESVDDSVGALICSKGKRLGAAAIVMAKHNQGALKEFLVGSVSSFCEFSRHLPRSLQTIPASTKT